MIEKYVCDEKTTNKQGFVYRGFECFVVERELKGIHPYYCGYVSIPKTKEVEEFFKQDLYDIEVKFPVGDDPDVAITYHKVLKDFVIVGFDRGHSGSERRQSLYETIDMTQKWIEKIAVKFKFVAIGAILEELKYKKGEEIFYKGFSIAAAWDYKNPEKDFYLGFIDISAHLLKNEKMIDLIENKGLERAYWTKNKCIYMLPFKGEKSVVFEALKRIVDDFLCAKKHQSGQEKVNHPSHYNRGGIECIEAIKASMSKEAYKGFLKGNFFKYVWRFEEKNGIEDLKKAEWYLKRLIEEME